MAGVVEGVEVVVVIVVVEGVKVVEGVVVAGVVEVVVVVVVAPPLRAPADWGCDRGFFPIFTNIRLGRRSQPPYRREGVTNKGMFGKSEKTGRSCTFGAATTLHGSPPSLARSHPKGSPLRV